MSIIAALGGLAATALGSAMNSKASRDSNQLNMRNWKEQAEYNSPRNQVQRLREAGVNPALALQNGAMDSGSMSNQAPDAVTPQYDFSPLSHGISESVGLYQAKRLQDSQIKLQDSQTQNQIIRNRTQLLRDIAEFSKLANDSSKSDAEREQFHWLALQAKKDYENYDTTYQNDQNLKVAQANSEQAHADKLNAEKEYQNILNKFEPDKQRIIISNLEKQGREIESAIRRNDADAAHSAAMAALAKAQEEGVQIDNTTQQELAGSVVDKAVYESDEKFWQSQQEAKKYVEGHNAFGARDGDGQIIYYGSRRGNGNYKRYMYKDKDGKYQFGFKPR